MPGNPNQGWQGQPGPAMPNTNPSMSQGQTLSTSSMSSMSRQSPGVLSGPNSAGESQPMSGMNSRIQNMGSMPPNIPMETQRGSPGLPGPAGEQGAAMMGRHNVRNSGPTNFPGNMPNQMNPQMSMANVRMPMGGMPGLGPGQRPMGPGMPSGQHNMPPGQHVMPPGQQMHGMPPGHPGQHNLPPGQHKMPPGQHNMPSGQHSMPPGQHGSQHPSQSGQHLPSGSQHNMNHNSPLNTVPQSPHGMVPQSPLSQQPMAPSPMSHSHMSPHPNMSPATNTPTHQPSSREDFNLDFLENISPPTTKSQTPMPTNTAPNDQELLNLFT